MTLNLEGRWEVWALRAALIALFVALEIDGSIAKNITEQIIAAIGIIAGIVLMFFEQWSARK